ncbi:hypothetical protein [Actinoplanes sp. NPDC051411]|uniref:hypothetical protein n=1 Tax=Actinoplanes sp. NPDC051411 TaxID=3155522 RepID=UPI003427620A
MEQVSALNLAADLAGALEGPTYNLISLIVGILGLIGTTIQAVVAVQQRAERRSGRIRRLRWRSLKRSLAKVAVAAIIGVSLGLEVLLVKLTPAPRPASCEPGRADKPGGPTLSLETSRALGHTFVEVHGYGFAKTQPLYVHVDAQGGTRRLTYSAESSPRATGDGYFETMLLMPKDSSGIYCVFAWSTPYGSGKTAEYDPDAVAGSRLTLG